MKNKIKLYAFLIFSTLTFNNATAMQGNPQGINLQLPPMLAALLESQAVQLTADQIISGIQFAGKGATALGEAAVEWFRDDIEQQEREIVEAEADIARVEMALRRQPNEPALASGLARAKAKKAQSERKLQEIKVRQEDWSNRLKKQADQGLDFMWGKLKEGKENRQIALQAAIQGDKKKEAVLESIKQLTDKETLLRMGITATAAIWGIIGFWYGAKLTYNYLEATLGKPVLVRESSRHDWKHFIKEKILRRKTEEANLEEVILPENMSRKLKFLADDTKSSVANQLPFRHVLFYGSPGTGKTMFAKKLAAYSDMDYAIMSGADFSQFQNGEDIHQLHKLFDWADQSKKGNVIFIDEADAFLRDRRLMDNQGKNLVNAFLSRTGTSSEKFMLVFATNYEDELDPAALSRIHKKVHFPLPALEERIKIFNLYFTKYIVNDVRRFLSMEDNI